VASLAPNALSNAPGLWRNWKKKTKAKSRAQQRVALPDSRAILVAQCADRTGLVATITQWFHNHHGNLLELDQHVDRSTDQFFIRIEWDLDHFIIPSGQIHDAFAREIGEPLGLNWRIRLPGNRPRMAILVSQMGHCLWDLLTRSQSGELDVDIPLVISNHDTFADTARQFGCDFHQLVVTRDNKADQEAQQLALLAEHAIDFVVLARYMQILSSSFASAYSERIINIHHSFLPAFAGAKPYHRAHERGVKIIGATAHYVTEDLDEGPIIDQDTVRVSHRDPVRDLIRKGRDNEKIVLSRAVRLHLEERIAVHDNRTIIFS